VVVETLTMDILALVLLHSSVVLLLVVTLKVVISLTITNHTLPQDLVDLVDISTITVDLMVVLVWLSLHITFDK
jgi:hypothetical protein